MQILVVTRTPHHCISSPRVWDISSLTSCSIVQWNILSSIIDILFSQYDHWSHNQTINIGIEYTFFWYRSIVVFTQSEPHTFLNTCQAERLHCNEVGRISWLIIGMISGSWRGQNNCYDNFCSADGGVRHWRTANLTLWASEENRGGCPSSMGGSSGSYRSPWCDPPWLSDCTRFFFDSFCEQDCLRGCKFAKETPHGSKRSTNQSHWPEGHRQCISHHLWKYHRTWISTSESQGIYFVRHNLL